MLVVAVVIIIITILIIIFVLVLVIIIVIIDAVTVECPGLDLIQACYNIIAVLCVS